MLEQLSPVKRTWNGANSSAWRRDIIAVNGFDESLRYGAEDVEMGVRLTNNGIIGRHIRYSTCLLHIEHSRGYADPETVQRNKEYVREVRKRGIVWTENGMVKPAARMEEGKDCGQAPASRLQGAGVLSEVAVK